jgi:Domain of unknown function (DUF4189)
VPSYRVRWTGLSPHFAVALLDFLLPCGSKFLRTSVLSGNLRHIAMPATNERCHMKFMPITLGIAAAAAATTFASPVYADTTYVAIAFSSNNGSHGWENNQPTFDGAVKGAMNNCRTHGGNQCKLVVSASNACAALFAAPPAGDIHVWGPPHTGTGPTLDAAERAATAPGGVPVEDTGIPLIVRCSSGGSGQG